MRRYDMSIITTETTIHEFDIHPCVCVEGIES